MGYSETSKPVGKDGLFVGEKDAEIRVASATGALYHSGTLLTPTAAQLNFLSGLTALAAELNGLDLSVVGGVSKIVKAPLAIVADTDPHVLAITIPDKAIIKRVWVDVTVKEDTGTTKTIDIGISSGDENGFLAAISVAAAGVIQGTLANGAQTRGALLAVDEDGAGALVPMDYVCTAATILCYTLVAADFAELAGNVFVEYIEVA